MTKFVSARGATRVKRYHHDPECNLLKKESKEAHPSEIEYHELDPCWLCADGDRPTNDNPTLKYQNATIDGSELDNRL